MFVGGRGPNSDWSDRGLVQWEATPQVQIVLKSNHVFTVDNLRRGDPLYELRVYLH